MKGSYVAVSVSMRSCYSNPGSGELSSLSSLPLLFEEWCEQQTSRPMNWVLVLWANCKQSFSHVYRLFNQVRVVLETWDRLECIIMWIYLGYIFYVLKTNIRSCLIVFTPQLMLNQEMREWIDAFVGNVYFLLDACGSFCWAFRRVVCTL